MLHSLARMLRATAATAGRTQRHFSVAQRLLGGTPRDYALPNDSWSADTRQIYERFQELSKDGSWRRLPSYNTSVHHRDGMSVAAERRTRLFTRSLEEDGAGFEYCMFYNAEEKRTVCVFQPGPYLEGPIGYTHGGCIATIIDVTVGTGIVYGCGYAMTANLSIDYRSPIPLGSTVIVDSRVDKQEGRKIYASCQVRSHDDRVLHNEATGLFIKVTRKDAEAKL